MYVLRTYSSVQTLISLTLDIIATHHTVNHACKPVADDYQVHVSQPSNLIISVVAHSLYEPYVLLRCTVPTHPHTRFSNSQLRLYPPHCYSPLDVPVFLWIVSISLALGIPDPVIATLPSTYCILSVLVYQLCCSASHLAQCYARGPYLSFFLSLLVYSLIPKI